MKLAEDNTARPGEHAIWPIKTPTVRFLEHGHSSVDNLSKMGIVVRQGDGNGSLDLVLLQPMDVVNNAGFSEPRHSSRAMVVESLDTVGMFSSITPCLSHTLFLTLEKSLLLIGHCLCLTLEGIGSNFEITLPCANFEELLACAMTPPQLVSWSCLLGLRVAATLLLVDPAMSIFAMLLHAAYSPTDIETRVSLSVVAKTPEAIKMDRERGNWSMVGLRIHNIRFYSSNVTKSVHPFLQCPALFL